VNAPSRRFLSSCHLPAGVSSTAGPGVTPVASGTARPICTEVWIYDPVLVRYFKQTGHCAMLNSDSCIPIYTASVLFLEGKGFSCRLYRPILLQISSRRSGRGLCSPACQVLQISITTGSSQYRSQSCSYEGKGFRAASAQQGVCPLHFDACPCMASSMPGVKPRDG
jgi:hypothetical protein